MRSISGRGIERETSVVKPNTFWTQENDKGLCRHKPLLFIGLLAASLFVVRPVTVKSQDLEPQSNTSQLQAVLVDGIDSRHVRVGQVFRLRTVNEWHGSGCTLRKNSQIRGHVSEVQKLSQASHVSRVVLTIGSADCQEQKQMLVAFDVVGIIAPGTDDEKYLHSVVPREIGGHGGTDALTATIDDQRVTPAIDPSTVQPNEVRGLKNVRLLPGDGVIGSSILISEGHNVQVSPDAVFLLLPASGAPVGVDLKPVQ